MVLNALILLAIGGTGLAVADDGEDGVQDMLNAIPEIEMPKSAEGEEKKPVDPEGMDLAAYMKECRVAVFAHFNPPKGVIKQQRDVEVTFVIAVDTDGTILSLSAPQRSGFKSFDAAAVKALNKVGKLPVPPDRWNPSLDKVLIPFNAQSGK
jgi:TonB family protein